MKLECYGLLKLLSKIHFVNPYSFRLEEINSLEITSIAVKKGHVFVIDSWMTGQRFMKITQNAQPIQARNLQHYGTSLL